MSRHECGGERKANLPLSTKLKLLGGAAAATLVGVVSGCGGSGKVEQPKPLKSVPSKPKPVDEGSKWDSGTEAKLQGVIKRPMDLAAREIISFAKKHPGMSHTFVDLQGLAGKGVDLSVSAEMKYTPAKSVDPEKDSTALDVITRRAPGSGGIDLGSVVGVSIYSLIKTPSHPVQEYYETIDLGAPGTTDTIFDNEHTNGWFAEQYGQGYIQPGAIYDSSTPGLYGVPRDPAATAEKIVNTVPSLLNFAEADLGLIAKMREPTANP